MGGTPGDPAKMLLAAACAIGSFFLSAHLAALTAGYRKRRSARRRCISAARGQKESLLDSRRRDFCPALSVSYANREPLLIVQGCGAFLRDDGGRAYLDTRNNVAHVGHEHGAVATAVSEQMKLLNTNTRYLHPNICKLARRLLRTFPPPLNDGVFFNSPTHPLFPICRTPFPPYVKNEFSFFVF